MYLHDNDVFFFLFPFKFYVITYHKNFSSHLRVSLTGQYPSTQEQPMMHIEEVIVFPVIITH